MYTVPGSKFPVRSAGLLRRECAWSITIIANALHLSMAKKKVPAKKSAVKKAKPAGKKKAANSQPKKEGSVRFEGILEKRTTSIGGNHYVRVPLSVSKFFGAKGSVRVLGTMNGIEVDRALIPDGEGGHNIIVGTDVRKKLKAVEGTKLTIDIYRNPNPTDIEIPEELSTAIEMEPEAVRKFAKMTPGMKRNMAYWVNSGKLPETRAKRAVEILRRIMNNYPFGGKKIE
jgi:hypothetical protein